MTYNVQFDICSLIFLSLLLFVSIYGKKLEDFQSKIYKIYLLVCFTDISLDVITCYGIAYRTYIPIWVNYFLNAVFLAMQCMVPVFYLLYIYGKVRRVKQDGGRLKWVFIPAGLGLLLVATNVWTGWIFTFNAEGYFHGPLHSYLYVNAGFYSVFTMCYAVAVRGLIGKKQCMLSAGIVVASILPTIIQFFMPSVMLSGLGTALGVFIMYMANENMVMYVDQITGARNRGAFLEYCKNADNKRAIAHICVLALDNFKVVNEVYGMEGGNRLLKMLVDMLQLVFSDKQVYRIDGDIFAVTVSAGDDPQQYVEQIKELFEKPYALGDMRVRLSACICLVHADSYKADELVQAMEYGVKRAKAVGKAAYFELDDQMGQEMKRRAAIEQTIANAIEQRYFEVHYQPIYDTENGTFQSMEALARLQVPEFGYVSPEEFIPIAEKNGTILEIGLLVLESVCRFIRQYNLSALGIAYIEVNLSVVQCMQERISHDIIGILDRYGVSPDMINLEITESAAAYSEERLLRNMSKLTAENITFSLDDYGSGYSNVNHLVDLPLSIVKIDKYIVWAAMKNAVSRSVLEHTVAMFKDIDLKVVAEGVEDLEMCNILTGMGVDYLQGYYFSKPLPPETLYAFLKEHEGKSEEDVRRADIS